MRTIDVATTNLQAAIAVIPARYRLGVQSADWETKAASDSAEQLWAQNVAAAAAAKRRQAGIHAAGNAKWQQASMNKGAANIGTGIQNGLAKYTQKFGPILQAMNSAAQSLPPRTADPLANIQNRLVPIVKAARQAAGKK